MSLDEELQRTFETLNGRLQDAVARLMSGVASDLAAVAKADREAASLDARAATEREGALRLTAALAAADLESADRLTHALASADADKREAAKSQREEGFKEGRGEGQEEGRAVGRDAGRTEARTELLAAGLAASRRLADGVRSLDAARTLGEVLDTLVSCAAREAPRAGVFLFHEERFSGWRLMGFGGDGPIALPADRIEFGWDAAGVIGKATRDAAAATGADLPAFATLPEGGAGLAVPMAIDGRVVAVLYADHAGTEPASMIWADTLEVFARHAGRCLETLAAFKAARAVADQGDATPPPRVAQAGREDPGAAQRYARLLVSEIKLYREADVVAGRLERDLSTRLAGEIARARSLYERRVPPHVRAITDHFRTELVRTLADGDESLL